MNYDNLTWEDLREFSASDFDKIPKHILDNLINQHMDQFPGYTHDSDRVMWDE